MSLKNGTVEQWGQAPFVSLLSIFVETVKQKEPVPTVPKGEETWIQI